MGTKFKFVQLGKYIEEANLAAMNRAAKMAITAVSRIIREHYNFKKKDLDQHIKITRKAEKGNTNVLVRITNAEIGLIHFGAKQIGKSGRSKKGQGPRLNQGVRAEVVKGQKKLFRSSDNQRGAFIAKVKGGKEQVFIRTATAKARVTGLGFGGVYKFQDHVKIKKLFGVSLTKLFKSKTGNTRAEDALHDAFDEAYEKRLEHEISRKFR